MLIIKHMDQLISQAAIENGSDIWMESQQGRADLEYGKQLVDLYIKATPPENDIFKNLGEVENMFSYACLKIEKDYPEGERGESVVIECLCGGMHHTASNIAISTHDAGFTVPPVAAPSESVSPQATSDPPSSVPRSPMATNGVVDNNIVPTTTPSAKSSNFITQKRKAATDAPDGNRPSKRGPSTRPLPAMTAAKTKKKDPPRQRKTKANSKSSKQNTHQEIEESKREESPLTELEED